MIVHSETYIYNTFFNYNLDMISLFPSKVEGWSSLMVPVASVVGPKPWMFGDWKRSPLDRRMVRM